MTFTGSEFDLHVVMKDGRIGIVIQINAQVDPYDVAVQVPGEANARYMAWDKLERVGGLIVEVD
jgi:hypothetical protein